MALRIRDKKERVNLFLEYFDCTYEVKPRTPFNQPDVLTMNFYYALKRRHPSASDYPAVY